MFTEDFLPIIAAAAGGGEVTGEGSPWVLLGFFIFAIGTSFFCSVWEAALLSISTPYIQSLEKKRPKLYDKLNRLKSEIDKPLISILTLNTLAHTLGAIWFGNELARVINGWSVSEPKEKLFNSIGGFVMVIAILILSEIIPKNLGARKWKAWAPWVASCLHILTTIMTYTGVIWVIRLISKGGHHQDTISREELTVMAEMGRSQGKIEDDESKVIESVLTLNEKTVEDIMTPRVVMFSLPSKMTVKEYFVPKYVKEKPFSRIPIYEDDDRENITGFVFKDDILIAMAEDKFETTLEDLKSDVAIVSELTSVPEALESMQDNKLHVAVVHDEYGGVTGIVTLEDFIEELWGQEIVDEVDTATDMQALAKQLWTERSQQGGLKFIAHEKDKAKEKKEEANLEVVKSKKKPGKKKGSSKS